MKIQKGIVKYKDRSDIVCTYGITDDGKQYYFIKEKGDKEEKRFSNGNRIATTALVEAVDDMVKPSNIGLISENGDVVIPFENKSIKSVNDDIILVEKAVPTSQNVIDTINLRSDPLSAAKLVSTAASIKDKLNAVIGQDGRFIFNDLFSEATVCDINGNNLVNNQYFSFICVSPSKNMLYFSTNVADSQVVQYSILPPQVQSDVTPTNDTNEIDVNEVQVSTEVVENALNNEESVEKVKIPEALSDGLVSNEAPVAATEDGVEAIMPQESLNSEVNPIAPEEVVAEVNEVEVPVADTQEVVAAEEVQPTEANEVEVAVPEEAVAEVNEVEVPVAGTQEVVAAEEVQPTEANEVEVAVPGEAVAEVNDVEVNIPEETNEDLPDVDFSDSIAQEGLTQDLEEDDNLDDIVNNIAETIDNVQENVDSEYNNLDVSDNIVEDNGNSLIDDIPEIPEINEDDFEEEDINSSEVETPVEEVVDAQEVETPQEEVHEEVVDAQEVEAPKEEVHEEVVDTQEVEAPQEEVHEEVVDTQEVEAPKEEVHEEVVDTQEVEAPKEEVHEEAVDTQEVETPQEEVHEEAVDTQEVETPQEEVHEEVVDTQEVEAPKEEFDLKLNDNIEEFDDTFVDDFDNLNTDFDSKGYDSMIDTDVFEDDLFKDSVVKADKIDLDEDLFVPSTYEEPSKKTSTGGSIMSDVAKSLNELIRRNKEYRSIISQYQDKVSSLNSQKSALTEKYHEQVQMNQSLTSKVSSLQTSVGKLQNKNESLEGKVSSLQSSMGKLQSINEILDSKVHNQEKLLYSQERELSSLRSQLEGKDDIVKLLADAKAVLGDDSNDYDSVDSYYRKVV